VITVIFVSYLGSRRHIPVWLGMGEWTNSFCFKLLMFLNRIGFKSFTTYVHQSITQDAFQNLFATDKNIRCSNKKCRGMRKWLPT
jgi:hypothetical protein